MTTIVDAFKAEDRVELTFSDFYRLMKESSKAELMANAVECGVPNKYIKDMINGPKEEDPGSGNSQSQ